VSQNKIVDKRRRRIRRVDNNMNNNNQKDPEKCQTLMSKNDGSRRVQRVKMYFKYVVILTIAPKWVVKMEIIGDPRCALFHVDLTVTNKTSNDTPERSTKTTTSNMTKKSTNLPWVVVLEVEEQLHVVVVVVVDLP
jgi:predicted nucleic acid-binding Zn ribbon protein